MTSALVLPPAYPSHRVADVALLDGSTVTVRPVLPEDADEVVALFGRLSATSTANRFHGMHRLTRREADYFTGVDYVKTFGLVAEHGSGTARHIVALASYIQTHPGIAATMFEVLAKDGINIEMISTSPIRISCVVRADRAEDAVQALHGAFELEGS